MTSNPRLYIKIDSRLYEDLMVLANLKSIYTRQWLASLNIPYLIYLPDCFVYSRLFESITNNSKSHVNCVISYKALHYLLRKHPSSFDSGNLFITPKYKLAESFIRYEMNLYGPSLLPWHMISKYSNLSLEFAIEFKPYLEWNDVISRCVLTPDSVKIIEDNLEYITWDFVSDKCSFTYDFIDVAIDKLNWKILSIRLVYDKNFIFRYQKYIKWDILMLKNKIDENFIITHSKSLDINMFIDKGLISKFRANALTATV